MLSGNDRVVITGGDIDRDRHTTWNKTWVVVVVLLLLLFSITWVFTRPIFEPEKEEDEPYPWQVPAEPMIISEDTTWTGRTETLDQPIVVQDGVTLRIEDSEISVDLVDLVFWQRPAFRVRAGGALEVDGSTLQVVQDDEVANTVLGEFNLNKHGVPNLARLVNLGNASDPVLSFDYMCRYAPVPIAIGVRPEHQPGLDVVKVYEPEASDVGNWTSVSVSLNEYAGSRPQVVIFPQSFPEGLMFISNLRVEEGGAAPIGDWFRTGNPQMDGWDLDGFGLLRSLMENYINGSQYSRGADDLWRGLIEADGDVTLEDSFLKAPDDLSRRGARERVKESRERDPAYEIIGTATRGGHIMVNGARLTIRNGGIENVPVLCNGTYVDISGTVVTGDADMFTLNASRGTLEAVDFTMREPSPGLPFREADQRTLWALGIENALEGYWTEVLNCTFTDCQQAIDLSHAEVKLAGCTFDSNKRITIWDHNSILYNFQGFQHEDWNETQMLNEFLENERDIYLKTRLTRVFFDSPDGEPREILDVGIPRGLDLYSPPDWKFMSYEPPMANVVNPLLLVDEEFKQNVPDVVYITVTTNSSRLYPMLEPDDAEIIVDLTKEYPHPGPLQDPLVFGGISKNPGQPVGRWDVRLRVIPHVLDATDLRVSIDVDGADENETDVPASGQYQEPVNFSVDIDPGLSLLNVSVTGIPNDDPGGDRLVLQEETYRLFRLEGDRRDLPPEILFEMDLIVIESGEEVLLGNLSPGETDEDKQLTFAGPSSTGVTIEGLSFPGGEIGISIRGDVSLDLSNVSLSKLGIYDFYSYQDNGGFDQKVEIDEMVCDELSIYVDARVELSNITSLSWSIFNVHGNEIKIRDSGFNGRGVLIRASNTNISITGCEVASNQERGIEIDFGGTGRLDVANCSFDGSYLTVFRSYDDFDLGLDLSIQDNEFIGDGAFLYVGYNLLEMDSYDIDTDYVLPIVGVIEGNTFRGEGAGAVLWHGLYEGLFTDNKVIGNAKLHAYYVLTFRVMDTQGTPSRPEFWLIPTETVTPSTLFNDRRHLTLEGEMMLDVTNDLSMDSNPPEVGVILLSGYMMSSMVGGFAPVFPLEDAGELMLYGFSENMGEFLLDHVKDWPG